MYKTFDPDLFRELYPVYEFEDGQACHALWIKHHRFDLAACTEAHLLKTLDLPLDAYPTAFPWKAYARLHPEAGRNRWVALEHFVHHGFDHIGVSLSYEAGAGAFLHALGRRYAHHDERLAIRALELALVQPDSAAGVKLDLAEAYERHQMWYRARALFVELIGEAAAQGDAHAGDARAAEVQRLVDGLLAASNHLDFWDGVLDGIARVLPIGARGRAKRLEAASIYFDRRARLARQHYLVGAKARGDAVMAETIDAVAAFLSAPSSPGRPSSAASSATVLVLVESLDDAPRRDRIEQHRRLLSALGLGLQVFTLDEIDAFRTAVAGARAAILQSIAAWTHVVEAIDVARASGCVTFYEIDDLVVSPEHSPPPLAAFDGLMGRDAYVDLLFGAAMWRGAASLCDVGLAPNASLGAHLATLVRTGRAAPVRLPAPEARVPSAAAPTGARASVFLRSLRAFIFDEREPAGAALLELLHARDDFDIVVTGYLQLSRAFDRFRSRFARVPVAQDHRAKLSACRINLVLDEGGERGACLPEQAWLDAAQLGIPTIAGATKAYRERLRDGTDVLLVRTPAEWTDAIRRLLDEPMRGAAIGGAARSRASTDYADAQALGDYRDAFGPLASA